MAFEKGQFREAIREVLLYLEPEIPYSDAAVELLMLTAATESHLGTYLRQVRGPALGVFQMEPATERDIWGNYLIYKDGLRGKLAPLMPETFWPLNPLEYNLAYQIAMARVHYLRVPERLPDADNLAALAQYWKTYFNTHLGRGVVAVAINDYQRFTQ